MRVNKPISDETYRDIGVDPDKARQLRQRRARETAAYSERREQIRLKCVERHGRECAAYKAHGIPFESCGGCRSAFEQEAEAAR